jgi:hypothetical protein
LGKSDINSSPQRAIIDWFDQEVNRPIFDGAQSHDEITVRCEKDDRGRSVLVQLNLEFKSIDIGEA